MAAVVAASLLKSGLNISQTGNWDFQESIWVSDVYNTRMQLFNE